MPFWSRKKKPHPETLVALEKVRKELEDGTVSMESETWRIMANEHVLNCVLDDIEHERITPEDASTFERYNEMTRKLREKLMTTIEEDVECTSGGECSEFVVIDAPIEVVWESWRDMEVISKTIMDGSAGRIGPNHFWIKRVDPDKGDVWLETYEETQIITSTHITAQKIRIEVQAIGMDTSLQEVNLEGKWLDYIDFEEISKNKTKLVFRTTFVPSEPLTDYGKIFLSMFTQTKNHPTMKEEIQHQLKKFKEIVEAQ